MACVGRKPTLIDHNSKDVGQGAIISPGHHVRLIIGRWTGKVSRLWVSNIVILKCFALSIPSLALAQATSRDLAERV